MSYTLIAKHESDKRTNRDGYISAMLELMKEDDKVVHIDCDLMSCINAGKLLAAYPDRTFNAGIAEQNAMACGRRHGCHRNESICTFFRLLRFPPRF